jgi:hypothetical protein
MDLFKTIDPLARNHGFRPSELRQIQRLVDEHQAEFWRHGFFDDHDG